MKRAILRNKIYNERKMYRQSKYVNQNKTDKNHNHHKTMYKLYKSRKPLKRKYLNLQK